MADFLTPNIHKMAGSNVPMTHSVVIRCRDRLRVVGVLSPMSISRVAGPGPRNAVQTGQSWVRAIGRHVGMPICIRLATSSVHVTLDLNISTAMGVAKSAHDHCKQTMLLIRFNHYCQRNMKKSYQRLSVNGTLTMFQGQNHLQNRADEGVLPTNHSSSASHRRIMI